MRLIWGFYFMHRPKKKTKNRIFNMFIEIKYIKGGRSKVVKVCNNTSKHKNVRCCKGMCEKWERAKEGWLMSKRSCEVCVYFNQKTKCIQDPSAIHLNLPCCVLHYKHTAYLCMHEFMTAVSPLNHQTNGRDRKRESILNWV